MPEGPSIVILREKLEPFSGKKVLAAKGTAGIDFSRISNQKIIAFKSWGKHLLICFKDCFIRIHLLMFGTYRINERRPGSQPKLHLRFADGEINFYTCNVKLNEGDPDDTYDWEADIMSGGWSARNAKKKLKATEHYLVSDALLNQDIFSGSGNIIKNEVLFITHIHPESLIDALPLKKLNELIAATRNYSFDFLKWKRVGKLDKNLQIYGRKECPRCKVPVTIKNLGKGKRLTYFCENCQEKYQ